MSNISFLGTTGLCQPLDVYYFRLYKQIVRHISESAEFNDNVPVWQREYYFKLQAFVHFQFQAPIFQEAFKYAWFKSGYLDHHPEPYLTPKEVCIDFDKLTNPRCSFSSCSSFAAIKCAHCSETFCYQHCIFQNLHINCREGSEW